MNFEEATSLIVI